MPRKYTFEEASKLTPVEGITHTFESLAGEPRYAANMAQTFARVGELQHDTEARQSYVRDYWREQGQALARSDVRFRDEPELAAIHLLQTTPKEVMEQVQERRSTEWQDVAKNKAVGEFFDKRKQFANALWNQVHLTDPEISEQDAYAHMHQQLELYGYQPPGAGALPPLVMREGQWENEYVQGWTEFRAGAKGVARGMYKLVHAAPSLTTMAGEAVHDWMHQDVMGAEVHGTNTYRDARHRMEIDERYFDQYVDRGIGDIPYLPEGFNIYEILGEQIPQFTLMAGTGQLVRAGLITKFMGRTATAATMFALETTDAYQQYRRYAADIGMDPRTASQIAAGGAIVYGTIAGILETVGPFELLSQQNPVRFNRLTRAAIVSLAEGGTEFTQAMTQHGIAHGLDLKDIDWDQIRSAMTEAVAGMIMGGAMGLSQVQGQGRTAEPPQIAGPGMSIDPGEMGPVTEVTEAPPTMYRAETGYVHPQSATAADVVRYEQEELGNDLRITEGSLADLENIPATRVVWATRTTEEAGRYGPDIQELTTAGGKILADIGPDGALILLPEVAPEMAPRVFSPTQIVDQMVEMTPEAERTDVTRVAFEANMQTLQHGDGPFVEVTVPVADLEILQITEEKLGPKVAEYAAQPSKAAPAIVAGTTAPGGQLSVVDGVHRVRAAQQRGDTTIRALIPQADAETIQPAAPVKAAPEAAPGIGIAQQIQEITRGESPEAIAQRQREIAAETEAETKLVKKSISLVQKKLGREGSKITDDESLGRVGTEIAKILGLPEGTVIDWKFKVMPDQSGDSGVHQTLKDGTHRIIIRHGTKYGEGAEITPRIMKRKAQAGRKPGLITPAKSNIYRVIIHELGHIAKPPIGGGPFAGDPPRKIHHDEFVQWVEEGVRKLIGTTYVEAPAVEPTVTPANVPMGEDMKPAPAEPGEAPQTVGGGIKNLLSDERGSWNPEVTGRVIQGGITVATEEAGTVFTGVAALTDESSFLRRTDAGIMTDELLNDAQAKAQRKIGEHNSKFLQTYDKLTVDEKRWLETIREDGQTNWATLREYPDRLDAATVPQAAIALSQVAAEQQVDSAQGAINSRLPQRRADGTVGIFQPAKTGRYYRILTPKGSAGIHSQAGPVFDALIEWLEAHPDRNPDLPDDAAGIREKLAGEQRSGKTKQANSLEYTRVFKELPTALLINGKWEAFQEMRPVNHFMSSNESQWRRIMFWEVMQDRLLTRYGEYNEKTGEYSLPHPDNKELTDVDGLMDRLRKDVVRQEGQRRRGNPAGAERAYNRMLEHYFRQFQGGLMEDVFALAGPNNRIMRVASIVDRNIMASILSFSGLWDVCQPTASAHIVGYRRLTKAYAKVMVDIVAHPQTYSAEYQAIGAVMLRHNDWMLRKTRDELTGGLLERWTPQAMMRWAEGMEKWSQTVTATAFDLWSRDVNGHLRDADARVLRKHLRLTDAEILEMAQGTMSDATQAKIIQNGVKTTNFLAEDPMHRGLLQNVPLLRFAVPFTSVVSGNLRAASRVVTDVVDDVKRIKRGDKAAVKDLIKSLGRMSTFLVACFGRGFVQNALRRLITGKPLLRPEEEDDWAGTLFESLGEGAVFGPYWRLLEAAKYSGGDPQRMAVNMLPRAAIWIEAISALGGLGRYEGTAWGKRMEKWGYKVSPAARSFRNWHDRLIHPGRADYTEVRSRVRLFLETAGEEPKRGYGPTNRYYYAIFEAVRDQNEVALDEAITKYKQWAKEKGRTSEEARSALRSALHARRPVNLREERMKEFLAGLTESQREIAEQQQREYISWMDRVTQRPGVKLKRRKKEKRPQKQRGGDWYGTD